MPAFATVSWFTVAGGVEKADFAPADPDEVPLDASRFAKPYCDVGPFNIRYVSARALEAIALSLLDAGCRRPDRFTRQKEIPERALSVTARSFRPSFWAASRFPMRPNLKISRAAAMPKASSPAALASQVST